MSAPADSWKHHHKAKLSNSDGHHLFTLLASLRALQAGARLATRLNDAGAAEFYLAQADLVRTRIADFQDQDRIWRATIMAEHDVDEIEALAAGAGAGARAGQSALGSHGRRLPRGRTGLDCALPLAVVHLGDDEVLGPAEPATLASLREYVLSFEGLYGVDGPRGDGKTSGNSSWTQGWAVGRYREDVYNGVGTSRGNPW